MVPIRVRAWSSVKPSAVRPPAISDLPEGDSMNTPDVSVIVAVYNTMPYLTTCLTSLVEQSIGPDRMEVIAVDDGSTDGSGKELDRFAELHPGTVRVLHQPNSGGPAAPSNRALDIARGRYVYFIGADDHLGPEALERLVEAADEYDSDVVVGKMVGVNGRWVHQPLFKSTEPEVRLDSELAWSLNNCKLFRRELIERHGLRYREDMPVCSDQPFTIEACVRARRISVLADYDYYYAVRRADAGNITFRSSLSTHLECGVEVLKSTAALIEEGPDRDALLLRHFHTEIGKIVGDDFLGLERPVQEEFCVVLGRVVDEYLTDAVRARLAPTRRIRLALAQRGAVDELCAAITMDIERNDPPIVVDGDRAYSRYPGFGDERLALPDDHFAISGDFTKRIAKGVQTSSVRWSNDTGGKRTLTVTARVALVGPSAFDPGTVRTVVVPLAAGKKVPGARRRPSDQRSPEPVRDVSLAPAGDGAGTEIRARIPADSLVEVLLSGARRMSVRLDVDVAGTTYEIPLPATGPLSQARHWRRGRPYRVSSIADESGRLVIAVAPIRPIRVVQQRMRRLGAGTGGTS
jgi:poly(ribitol-phosphate) beta-N-acetylglucosaminyltransferase